MTAQWKKYTGSDEQIAEINSAKHGVRYKDNSDKLEVTIMCDTSPSRENELRITHYLICNPHPLADMICQQAMTGQPVWVRYKDFDKETGFPKGIRHYVTTTPHWSIPGAEYSFTQFEELNNGRD